MAESGVSQLSLVDLETAVKILDPGKNRGVKTAASS